MFRQRLAFPDGIADEEILLARCQRQEQADRARGVARQRQQYRAAVAENVQAAGEAHPGPGLPGIGMAMYRRLRHLGREHRDRMRAGQIGSLLLAEPDLGFREIHQCAGVVPVRVRQEDARYAGIPSGIQLSPGRAYRPIRKEGPGPQRHVLELGIDVFTQAAVEQEIALRVAYQQGDMLQPGWPEITAAGIAEPFQRVDLRGFDNRKFERSWGRGRGWNGGWSEDRGCRSRRLIGMRERCLYQRMQR